jgi:hypothetical protein
MPGAATSEAEVTNISQHGFWLLLDGRELFLPFEESPKLRALGPIGSEGGAMTTKKPSSPDDQSPSAPVPMDAGSARTTLHKLAARFWLHPGYIGTRTGSVVR